MYNHLKKFLFVTCALILPIASHTSPSTPKPSTDEVVHENKKRRGVFLQRISAVVGVSAIIIIGYFSYKGYNHYRGDEQENISNTSDFQPFSNTQEEGSHGSQETPPKVESKHSIHTESTTEGAPLDNTYESDAQDNTLSQATEEDEKSTKVQDQKRLQEQNTSLSNKDEEEHIDCKINIQEIKKSCATTKEGKDIERLFTTKTLAECTILGTGGLGNVYQVNDQFVLKVAKKIEKERARYISKEDALSIEKENALTIKKENVQIKKLECDNMITTYGMVYLTKDNIYALLLEKLEDVKNWDESKCAMSDTDFIQNIALPLLNTIKTWKENKLVHSDLSNCKNFMQRKGVPVIIDPMVRSKNNFFHFNDQVDTILSLFFLRTYTYLQGKYEKKWKDIIDFFEKTISKQFKKSKNTSVDVLKSLKSNIHKLVKIDRHTILYNTLTGRHKKERQLQLGNHKTMKGFITLCTAYDIYIKYLKKNSEKEKKELVKIYTNLINNTPKLRIDSIESFSKDDNIFKLKAVLSACQTYNEIETHEDYSMIEKLEKIWIDKYIEEHKKEKPGLCILLKYYLKSLTKLRKKNKIITKCISALQKHIKKCNVSVQD